MQETENHIQCVELPGPMSIQAQHLQIPEVL
jgi:hypothetical protein